MSSTNTIPQLRAPVPKTRDKFQFDPLKSFPWEAPVARLPSGCAIAPVKPGLTYRYPKLKRPLTILNIMAGGCAFSIMMQMGFRISSL
jgi:hypothetical protein